MSKNPIEPYGREEQLTDSVLLKLQQNNDVVIAFAVANYAWVKKITYQIITMKDNEWKGYTYSVNYTSHTSAGPTETEVSRDSCEALWRFIQEKNAIRIKGDQGEDFCSGDQKANCNINDGANWQLFFISGPRVADPSYYEPQFYENCCPGNKERQLFITVAEKIKALVGTGNAVK